jgi:hypothetical protein
MSAGLWAIVCLIITAGVAIGCWAIYASGRSSGYLKGYHAGRMAERQSAEATINEIRRRAEQEVQAVKERGQAASAFIDYLYEQTLAEVDQLGSPNTDPAEAEQL